MALGTNQFSASTVVAMVPEVWTPVILEEMFAKAVFSNFITDLSKYVTAGGDTIHVPDVYTNTFTTQTQSTQGAVVTLSNPAQNDVTLSTWTHNYIALQVGDKELIQLSKDYDFNAIYARKIGGQLINALEASIAALWSGLSTNSSGDTATVLSDAEIRAAINKLASLNFSLSETAFFLHPYVFWNQLSAVAKYYDASQVGAPSVVRTGNFGVADASRGLIGGLYNIPIYQTTNVVSGLQTYRNLLLHKECLGFAIQTPGASNGKVRVQSDNRLEYLSNVTVADILFTTGELRDNAGVVVNASNSFIGS